MNIKKFLATGLIASVAIASVEANDTYVEGGVYLQGGFGLSLATMKYKNNLKPQRNVIIAEERTKLPRTAVDLGVAGNTIVYDREDLLKHSVATDATKTSFNKHKNLFQCDFGFGFDKRLDSMMLGVTFSFGKNFGTVTKKETGLALANGYLSIHDIAFKKICDITGYNAVTGRVYNGAGAYNVTGALDLAPDDFVAEKTPLDNATLYQRDLELELKCKNKYYISIMPRIGVLVNPRLELYVTAGVKIKSDKYTLTAVAAKKSAKKTVTKCIPSFGLGLQYNFQNGMFTNLSYTFNLKAKKTFKFKANNKLNLNSTVKHTLQNSSHDVKWGIGYRF